MTIFEWRVEWFPKSGNAYDSLAEAYVKRGERELVIRNCRCALELDPKSANAEKMLAERSQAVNVVKKQGP